MATASLRMRHVSGEINGQHSGVPIVMIHFLRWAIARHAVAIATLLLAFFNTASVPALLGGTENFYFGDDASLKNDVWHSLDGRQWQRLETPTQWKARHEHSVFVFQDKLWVARGHAQPLSSEVWSLSLPEH